MTREERIEITRRLVEIDERLQLSSAYISRHSGISARTVHRLRNGSTSVLQVQSAKKAAAFLEWIESTDPSVIPSKDYLRRMTYARRAGTKAGYIGVHNHGRGLRRPYEAKIFRNGRVWSLGYFETAEEAARARDAEAKKLGRKMNFPEDE